MHTQLLTHSPLLLLPLAATFLFLAVWVITAIRVMTRPGVEIRAVARLPLEDDHVRR